MTNQPYPPLPEPAELGFEATEGIYLTGYTADDMRAYVDADREQRKPLTDEQCDRRLQAVYAFNESFGLSQLIEFLNDKNPKERAKVLQNQRRDAIRAALNPPPGPDVANKGETN